MNYSKCLYPIIQSAGIQLFTLWYPIMSWYPITIFKVLAPNYSKCWHPIIAFVNKFILYFATQGGML